MTRAARDGAMATCYTRATRRKVIALTFILCSLQWLARKAFLRGLKLDFQCQRTRVLAILPVITAGLSSSIHKTDGCRWIYRRRGNTPRRRIIFSAAMRLHVSRFG